MRYLFSMTTQGGGYMKKRARLWDITAEKATANTARKTAEKAAVNTVRKTAEITAVNTAEKTGIKTDYFGVCV